MIRGKKNYLPPQVGHFVGDRAHRCDCCTAACKRPEELPAAWGRSFAYSAIPLTALAQHSRPHTCASAHARMHARARTRGKGGPLLLTPAVPLTRTYCPRLTHPPTRPPVPLCRSRWSWALASCFAWRTAASRHTWANARHAWRRVTARRRPAGLRSREGRRRRERVRWGEGVRFSGGVGGPYLRCCCRQWVTGAAAAGAKAAGAASASSSWAGWLW